MSRYSPPFHHIQHITTGPPAKFLLVLRHHVIDEAPSDPHIVYVGIGSNFNITYMGVPGKPKIDLSEDVVCRTLPSIKLITAQKLNLKKFPIVSLDIYPNLVVFSFSCSAPPIAPPCRLSCHCSRDSSISLIVVLPGTLSPTTISTVWSSGMFKLLFGSSLSFDPGATVDLSGSVSSTSISLSSPSIPPLSCEVSKLSLCHSLSESILPDNWIYLRIKRWPNNFLGLVSFLC